MNKKHIESLKELNKINNYNPPKGVYNYWLHFEVNEVNRKQVNDYLLQIHNYLEENNDKEYEKEYNFMLGIFKKWAWSGFL